MFKFPNPGRLEGINSTTRKICFLENVDSDQLSISAEQFEQGIAETRKKMDQTVRDGSSVDRLREGSIDQFDPELDLDNELSLLLRLPPEHLLVAPLGLGLAQSREAALGEGTGCRIKLAPELFEELPNIDWCEKCAGEMGVRNEGEKGVEKWV